MSSIWDGIAIGAAGGAIAGITVYSVRMAHERFRDWLEGKRVYEWIQENTKNDDGKRFCSTRTIASWNNLTEDRVRYLCSQHPKIFLSTGDNEDMWSLYERQVQPRVRRL